jgi:hypothetical protein
MLGTDTIYRTVVPLWRRYFHPSTIPTTTWDQGRLVDAPALGRCAEVLWPYFPGYCFTRIEL